MRCFRFFLKEKTGVLHLLSIYLRTLTRWQLLPFISECRHHTPGLVFEKAARVPPRDATWTDAAVSIRFNKAGSSGLFARGVSSQGKTGGLLINMAFVPQTKQADWSYGCIIYLDAVFFLYRKPNSPDSNLHSDNTFVYMFFFFSIFDRRTSVWLHFKMFAWDTMFLGFVFQVYF